MSNVKSQISNNRGVSLIEVLLVIVVLFGIVLLMQNFPNAINLINKSNHLSIAREIAAKQIEDKRSTNYLNLVSPSTTNITSSVDARMNLLPSGSGQLEINDCDPLICTTAEEIKQIKVTINWKENNKNQTISLDTLIGSGGLNQ